MKYSDLQYYHFDLPDELIARYPSDKRGEDRLLIVDNRNNTIQEKKFSDIENYFSEGDLLIRNNTRVDARRVYLKRISGALVEALFLTYNQEQGKWEVLINRQKRLKQGEELRVFLQSENKLVENLSFSYEKVFTEIDTKTKTYLKPLFENAHEIMNNDFWNSYGYMPIPPYLKRKAEELDKYRYQTVFANRDKQSFHNSKAAPTAGLHFTNKILSNISQKGCKLLDLQLEIGLGTFAPLQENNFTKSSLHSESYFLSDSFVSSYNSAKEKNKNIFILGTTSLRALESSYKSNACIKNTSWTDTDIFISPPYKFQSGNILITNFHLPASSLFLLVSAFAGKETIMQAYLYAIKNKFRFYSYGDCMMIIN